MTRRKERGISSLDHVGRLQRFGQRLQFVAVVDMAVICDVTVPRRNNEMMLTLGHMCLVTGTSVQPGRFHNLHVRKRSRRLIFCSFWHISDQVCVLGRVQVASVSGKRREKGSCVMNRSW
jgi:hypothetical protein